MRQDNFSHQSLKKAHCRSFHNIYNFIDRYNAVIAVKRLNTDTCCSSAAGDTPQGSAACTCTSNCASDHCNDDGSCTECITGYKLNGGKCESCNVAHCSSYSSGCICDSCNSNYELNDSGECKQKCPELVQIGNLYWTTRNPGEACGPALPYGIHICGADLPCASGAVCAPNGTYHSPTANICWSGVIGNGYLCNQPTANAICSHNDMRLPTRDEIFHLIKDHDPAAINYNTGLSMTTQCKGSCYQHYMGNSNGHCAPDNMVSSDVSVVTRGKYSPSYNTYYYHKEIGIVNYSDLVKAPTPEHLAMSVRCVK